MKKIMVLAVTAAISLFTINHTYAQDAKKMLQTVSSTFGGNKSVKTNFTLNYKDSKGASKSSQTGSILLKGSKYKIEMAGMTIISDNKSTWTYNKKDKEVQIDKFNPNAAISPSKLFAGNYEKDYTYKLNGTAKIALKDCHVIELTPKVKKDFNKVELYVSKSNNALVGSKIYEKTGNTIDFTLSETNTNAAISDADFSFDPKKYPGVEVIDLR